MEQKTLAGTLLKMKIDFRYPSDPTLTLDDISFSADFFCRSSRAQHFLKSDLIREVETTGNLTTVNWYALVDTSLIGPGVINFRLTAEIPDDIVGDGVRTEIAQVKTNVIIS